MDQNLCVGAGTELEKAAFIEAVLPTSQYVTSVMIKPLNKEERGPSYLIGCKLEYSNNGVDFAECRTLDESCFDQALTFEDPFFTRFWRIRREEEGYIAVGFFKIFAMEVGHYKSNLPLNFHNIPYTLTMSSKDTSLSNTYEVLQRETGLDGAESLDEPSPWIMAELNEPTLVQCVKVRPIRKSEWGPKYLSNCSVYCSEDGENWILLKDLEHTSNDMNYVLCEVKARYVKISTECDEEENQYIGVGSFIVRGVQWDQ